LFVSISYSALLFLFGFSMIALLALIALPFVWLTIKLLRKPDWFWPALIIGTILVHIINTEVISFQLDNGQLKDLYILSNGKETRLVVWTTKEQVNPYTRIHLNDYYSNRLKSYDLNSGKHLGSLYITRRTIGKDFLLYGSHNGLGWVVSQKTGIMLVDLFNLKVLAKQKEIINRNQQIVLPLSRQSENVRFLAK